MLGCIQPISSPMMKRMLGFCCCCADAGPLAIEKTAAPASKPSQHFRDTFMAKVSYCRVETVLNLSVERCIRTPDGLWTCPRLRHGGPLADRGGSHSARI